MLNKTKTKTKTSKLRLGHERINMKYLQKLFNKVMDRIGVKSFIYVGLTLVLVSGMWVGKHYLATYIVKNFVSFQ